MLLTFKIVKKIFDDKNVAVILTDYYERTDYVETRAPSFFSLLYTIETNCAPRLLSKAGLSQQRVRGKILTRVFFLSIICNRGR